MLVLVVLAAWPALAPRLAPAADWGGIEPGVTSAEQVRERYGAPTRETKRKVEGYDTFEWLYEGRQAPVGFIRMTVEFGLLAPSGYHPSVVRVLRLDPKPFIFGRDTILDGWGVPDQVGTKDERDMFVYRSGLVVTFDKSGALATSLYFTVRQPEPGETSTPRAGAPAPPSSAPAATPAPRR